MTLIWSPEVQQDLRDIRAFISQDNPGSAKTIVARIVKLVSEQLSAHPEIGRRILERLVDELGETVTVESMPQKEGNQLHTILAPRGGSKRG